MGTLDGLVGLAAEFNGNTQIYSRTSNDIDVSLSTNSFDTNNIKIYPNPVTNDVITIRHQLGNQVQLYIYSINGKRLMTKKIAKNETLDVSDLSTGIYFVNLINDSQQITQKIIIK
jgi:hypothetical protein